MRFFPADSTFILQQPWANEYDTQSTTIMGDQGPMRDHSGNPQWAEPNIYLDPGFNIVQEPKAMFQLRLRLETEAMYGTVSHPTPGNGRTLVPASPILHMMADHSRSTGAAQSADAHADVTTIRIAHSCSATRTCRWPGEGNSEHCDAEITCENVPTHFADAHGIKNLGSSTRIHCLWGGCNKQVTRQNFVRHIREPHLVHPREKKHLS